MKKLIATVVFVLIAVAATTPAFAHGGAHRMEQARQTFQLVNSTDWEVFTPTLFQRVGNDVLAHAKTNLPEYTASAAWQITARGFSLTFSKPVLFFLEDHKYAEIRWDGTVYCDGVKIGRWDK